jgi:WD40-like Beta Propeller Repeat
MSNRTFVSSAALLFASVALTAQAPSGPWRTIETAHFRVHFPAQFEPWARRAAGAIESIHDRVTEAVGWRPGRPIEVVIGDPQATSNGMAFPFLDRPAVVLWASPPEAESGIGWWTDWMEDLVVHEVTHIVHLGRPRNRSRGILARLSPLPVGPVLLKAPRWLSEGYATLIEGALTGSGRPASSFRAMVLRRFAMDGKLPGYAALSSTSGWLGGSMAYLVGSTFLEWLEAREGKGSLQKLWKRMASRRGGDFPTAFRAVFGRLPSDLYDRFRAEITALALEEEKRLRSAGLVDGDTWQRLEGGTLSLSVSPDGSKVLARRDPKRGETYLAVWTTEPEEEERRGEERRREREAQILKDPEEIADRPEVPARRNPRWRLSSLNGFSAENPRWLPDGRGILFARRAPDRDAVLRLDLWVWTPEDGHERRVTELADVVEADPAPDGRWAAGVRVRYGVSDLVAIDLASGALRTIAPAVSGEGAWRVWSHPRVSPDGATIAALLHTAGHWRLVTLPAGGGAVREIPLPGSPAGAPAWSADGSRIFVAADREGIWNVESVPVNVAGTGPADLHPPQSNAGTGPADLHPPQSTDAPSASELLTRVTGGALDPAPSADGKSLFFLEVTSKGVDVQRLALPAPALTPLGRRPESFPVLPPDSASPAPFTRSSLAPDHPYRIWPSHIVRPLATYSVGPDGNAWQIGIEGSDVLGRLDWVALGSVGNDAGPRGASIAASYRGLPVALSAHAFFAREKPGSQRVVRRREFDQERSGGVLEASWWRPFSGGRVRIDAGGGWTRVEPLAGGDDFDRSLVSIRARARARRLRGKNGFGFDVDVSGSSGSTDGSSWRQFLAGAGVSGFLPLARISASGRYGDTTGSPTRFDVFSIGGAPSSVLPAGLDRNRIELAALPAFVQTGDRVESARGELEFRGLPIVVYGERLRAWSDGQEKPRPVRVFGAELRIDERLLPIAFSGELAFYAGIAKIRSTSPRFDSTRGYAGLLYRP